MKTLILVRHGKSSWEYEVGDKDRPLKERGINDAYLVGSVFRMQAPEIDAAYSSPANRALHTALILMRSLNYPLGRFQITEDLYDFSGGSVARFVQGLDDALQTVIIFGHNHAFTHIANQWGSESIDNVPTSGLVQLSFNINSWRDIQSGQTEKVIFPKSHR